MRRHVRDQVIALFKTVLDSVAQIRILTGEKACTEITGCYISVKAIENALQAGFSQRHYVSTYAEAIAYLKQLLSFIYELKEVRNETDTDEQDSLYRELEFIVKQFEEELENDPEVKIEVVFLPYKASMWDSLESIWKEADADPRCDTYVVPIPYYDRKPGFDLGAAHYEGGLFPSDVPVLYYERYNLEERKPDVVYIHSPYDEKNYVTTVDPRYYSIELKKHTGLLVYVPYFVGEQKISEHFCKLPGVLNADRVIVQSEEIKKQYIKFSGQPDSKFLAFGSPKIDKVLNAKKENYVLPKEWEDQIKGRKIVLYNTSLNGMLRCSDHLIAKLKHVFSCFAKRHDIVLWWRPHPLSKSTATTIRPQIFAAYNDLENWYREKKIGVFDDSPDVHRAIAVSNAYYGDYSSLVPLYKTTGKPFMIQNHEMTCVQADSLFFYDCAIQDGCMYFFHGGFNGLFSLKLETGQIDFLGQVPGEDLYKRDLYRGVVLSGNKLFLAPFAAEKIAVYDLKTHLFTSIPLIKTEKMLNTSGKFFVCFPHGAKVFMVGCRFPAIAEIDTQTLEVRWHTSWYHKHKNALRKFSGEIIFRQDAVVIGDTCYLGSCQSNEVFEFCLKTGKSRFYSVGSPQNRYTGICFDGESFWLAPKGTGSVVQWNKKTKMCREYDAFPNELPREELITFSCIEQNGQILLYYERDMETLVLNPATGVIQADPENPMKRGTFFAKKIGDIVYSVARFQNVCRLLVRDIATGKETAQELPLPETLRPKAREAAKERIIAKRGKPIEENFFMTMDGFLDALSDSLFIEPSLSGSDQGQKADCGRKTHEAVMEIARRSK